MTVSHEDCTVIRHILCLIIDWHAPARLATTPVKGLVGGLPKSHVEGGDAVVERQAALHRAVLCERVDDGVRSVVAQQRWHVALWHS